MYVVIVDLFAALLIVGGIVLVARRPPRPDRSPDAAGAADDPGTYVRRIGGTMLAAFGLALGLMVTLYHFASAG